MVILSVGQPPTLSTPRCPRSLCCKWASEDIFGPREPRAHRIALRLRETKSCLKTYGYALVFAPGVQLSAGAFCELLQPGRLQHRKLAVLPGLD